MEEWEDRYFGGIKTCLMGFTGEERRKIWYNIIAEIQTKELSRDQKSIHFAALRCRSKEEIIQRLANRPNPYQGIKEGIKIRALNEVFDKIEDIEEYLKSHLASEFEKIKNAWQDYKDGKISKRELIKNGLNI